VFGQRLMPLSSFFKNNLPGDNNNNNEKLQQASQLFLPVELTVKTVEFHPL
jgi:hypothetical protein